MLCCLSWNCFARFFRVLSTCIVYCYVVLPYNLPHGLFIFYSEETCPLLFDGLGIYLMNIIKLDKDYRFFVPYSVSYSTFAIGMYSRKCWPSHLWLCVYLCFYPWNAKHLVLEHGCLSPPQHGCDKFSLRFKINGTTVCQGRAILK